MSAAEVQVERIRRILVEWMGKQGHERCWYYPEVFQAIIDELGMQDEASPGFATHIPRAEFEAGCRRYAADLYEAPRIPPG